MCGVCGMAHRDKSFLFEENRLTAMRDALIHRGPDDAGNYLASGIALGARRLAILDLSKRGSMPMGTPDGRYQIVYNGEIYNYRDFRPYLESKGWHFRSNTDTEVLLYLYAQDGPAILDKLNGMFAFAIWDNKERVLFLGRDRLGVKPLYYTVKDGIFYFASEEKAFSAIGVPPEFDAETLEELLLFRYVAGERTPFKGIKRLLPGHYLVWHAGEIQIKRWWNLFEKAREMRESRNQDPVAWFREIFDDAVCLRKISDVPVGVLLSGGLDSGNIAASLASQSKEPVSSFTVRFEDAGYDEGPLAQKVAKRWSLNYHEMFIARDQLMPLFSRAAWFNDEPLAHGNDLHLLAISKYAKPRVTVLLSGEGGDETLGGYVRYQPLRFANWFWLARPLLSLFQPNRRWRKLKAFFDLKATDLFVLYNSCDIFSENLEKLGLVSTGHFPYRQQILEESKSLYPGEPFRQAMYLDQHTFLCSLLDRNDRMTMGASIECRTPFLDYRLVEGLAALPSSAFCRGKTNKWLLRQAFRDRLPKECFRVPKWGFGVPWERYLKEERILQDYKNNLRKVSFIAKFFDLSSFDKEIPNDRLVFALVNLSLWFQQIKPRF